MNDLLIYRNKEILINSGYIYHEEAINKAHNEYAKYRAIQDQKYLSSMGELYIKYLMKKEINNMNKHNISESISFTFMSTVV